MNKINEIMAYPKLRFSSFINCPAWNNFILGEIASFSKGKGISKSEIECKGHTPCIRYGELYTKYSEKITHVFSFTNIPRKDLVLSCPNDIIIPASGETHIDIATASCVISGGIAVGGDINIIRSENDGVFLSYYLNGVKKKEIAEMAQGISVIHLYSNQLKSLRVDLPPIEEQKKIADCLSSIDELITAQNQKLEALKAHKKGLMQQLFPAEGETVPKLRFPRYKEHWSEKKISQVLTRVSNPVEVNINKSYRQIGIRSHGKGLFYKDFVTGKALGNKRVFWVEKDAFIVNIVFAWELAVAHTTASEMGMIASHRFPMYKPKNNNANTLYMKYFFLTSKGKELLWIASPGGAGRNKTLGQKDFENLDILLPDIEEQNQIANVLNSLDLLIKEQSKKCEILKLHKKGLMQQLFPRC